MEKLENMNFGCLSALLEMCVDWIATVKPLDEPYAQNVLTPNTDRRFLHLSTKLLNVRPLRGTVTLRLVLDSSAPLDSIFTFSVISSHADCICFGYSTEVGVRIFWLADLCHKLSLDNL